MVTRLRTERHWALARPSRLVVATALIAGMIMSGFGVASVLQSPDRFESVATLVIDQPRLIASAGSEGIIAKLNALRGKYAALLRTQAFTKPVAEKLNIGEGDVARATGFFLPGPCLCMLIIGRTERPARAGLIADAMAEELVKYVAAEQERVGVPAEQRIVFSIVAPASPGRKVAPTRGQAVSTGVVSGVVTLLAVYLLLQFVRARRAVR